MKQNINLIYSAILIILIAIIYGCDTNDDDNIGTTATEDTFVYFAVDSVQVSRSASGPLTVEVRYQGPKISEDIEMNYTITYPNENNAVEGTDFILPKSGSFIIEQGQAITKVVLLQRIIDNEEASIARSLQFELQPKEGITIGSSSNSGNSVNITLMPSTPEIIRDPNDPNDFIGDKKFTISEGGTTFKIPYFSNRDDIRDINNNMIKRAVIALHGSGRTAGSYYTRMLDAAKMETNNLDSLLIVSPQFIIEEDLIGFALDEEHLYWSSSGWRIGFTSSDEDSNPRPERVSSFTVMDSLFVKLSEYPNLKTIVLSGHSAGGQFVNRYAASSLIPDALIAKGIKVSFIVNNPGSYVYMDDKRKVPGTEKTFEVPSSSLVSNCPEYNEYKYGLEGLPFYLREVGGSSSIHTTLPKRRVTYLIGQNDNDPNFPGFDDSCEVQFQGRDRFERAINYFDHLIDFFGPSIQNTQKIRVVPGVGHSSRDMFQSESGRKNTFRN